MEAETNSVIDEIKPSTLHEDIISKQRLLFFGHVKRSNDILEKSVVLGLAEGSKKRESPITHWIDNIKELSGMKLGPLIIVYLKIFQFPQNFHILAQLQFF